MSGSVIPCSTASMITTMDDRFAPFVVSQAVTDDPERCRPFRPPLKVAFWWKAVWQYLERYRLPQEVNVSSAVLTARRRSEEHTSELQSLMRTSYAVFCLKKKT